MDERKPSTNPLDKYRETLSLSFGSSVLDRDAINILPSLVLPDFLHLLKPLQHYEEYVRQNNKDPLLAEEIMRRSDPRAVIALDTMIDEFNADVQRIKETSDFPALETFVKRALEIIKKGIA